MSVESLPAAAAHHIDQVCDRFEAAWKEGRRPRLEEFLGDAPEPERTALLSELVAVELAYRRRAAESPALQEYLERFPDRAESLRGLFTEGVSVAPRGNGSTAPWGAHVPEGFPVAREPPGVVIGVGSVVGGYALLEKVGSGGMGLVYRAWQPKAGRLVALKVVRPSVAQELSAEQYAEWGERFRREARLAAGLEHPDIVPVYEVGECEGQPFFSMRWIDGPSLAEVLRDGPLPGRGAAAFVERVARAVHFAHRRGVLHRDLKPANILLRRKSDIRNPKSDGTGKSAVRESEPETAVFPGFELPASDLASVPSGFGFRISDFDPVVTDFGLAKWVGEAGGITQTGACLGSPSYMAPEQARDSAHVTAASDVYSLGATLYDLVTGRPPFRAAHVAETLHQVVYREPVPPRQLNPAVDRDLETITLKCLSKEPAQRYPSAQALADDLRRYLGGAPIRARPIGAARRLWRWGRRNPTLAGLAAAVVLLAVGLLGLTGFGYWNVSRAWEESKHERDQAREVSRAALLDQARALRLSTEAGRRWRALDALRQAAAIRPGADLRDEYLRCLELLDVRSLGDWGRSFGEEPADTKPGIGQGRMEPAPPPASVPVEDAGSPGEWLGESSDLRYVVWRAREEKKVYLRRRGPDPGAWSLTDHAGNPVVPHVLTFGPHSDMLAVAYDLEQASRPEGKGQGVLLYRLTDRGPDPDGSWRVGGPGVDCLCFSPVGTLLAAGSNLPQRSDREYGVRFWDVAAKKEADPLSLEPSTGWQGALRAPGRIAFSPDGRFLAAARGTARLWDLAGEPPREVWSRSLDPHPADVVYVLPDAAGVITVGREGTLKLWDAFGGGDLAVAATPDGPQTAGPRVKEPAHSSELYDIRPAGSSVSVRAWEWAGPASSVHRPAAPAAANAARPDHFALFFSPDERWLAFASGPTDQAAPYLLDLTRPEAAPVALHEGGALPRLLAFSPTADQLWSAARGQQTVWKLAGLVPERAASPDFAVAAAFSPEGRTVACLRDMVQTKVVDLATGSELWQTPAQPGGAEQVSPPRFSPDGSRLLLGFRDAARNPAVVVQSWDVRRGELGSERAGGTGHFYFQDSVPMALMGGPTLAVRDLDRDQLVPASPPAAPSPAANYDRFAKFFFSDDGRLCAESGLSGDIAVWNVGGPERTLRCVIARHRPESFEGQDLRAFSPDGARIAAYDGTKFLKVWDTQTGAEIGRLPLDSRPELFAFDLAGKEILLIYLGRDVRAWRPENQAVHFVCPLQGDAGIETDRQAGWWQGDRLLIENAVQVAADRSSVVYVSWPDTGGERTIFRWGLPGGSLQRMRLRSTGADFPNVALSPHGDRIAVLDAWGDMRLTNLDTGAEYGASPQRDWVPKNRLRALERMRRSTCFSPDGTHAAWVDFPASPGAAAVHVLNLATRAEVFRGEFATTVSCIALSNGGPSLAVGQGDHVAVVDLGSREQRVWAIRPTEGVTAAAFDAGGDLLATASARHGTVTLWNPRGERLANWDTGWSGVQRVALSPSGRWLAALDHRGRVRLWDLREVRRRLQDVGLDW
jgi:serine/threonine protein kinase/WD40 repeat protein